MRGRGFVPYFDRQTADQTDRCARAPLKGMPDSWCIETWDGAHGTKQMWHCGICSLVTACDMGLICNVYGWFVVFAVVRTCALGLTMIVIP